MSESMKNLFDFLEQEIDSGTEYSAIEKLKSSGLEHNKACGLVETFLLYKNGYFSPFFKLKQLFFRVNIKDANSLFRLLSQYLVSSRYYSSLQDIENKILDSETTLKNIELQFGYRDDLYYYSSEDKRKIIILNNLHYDDFSKSLQKNVINLLGKANIIKSINDRTKYVYQKLQTSIDEAQKIGDQTAKEELEILESLLKKHTYHIR